MLDEHHKRLQHCYLMMFEQSKLPFTYQELVDWVHHALRLNLNGEETLNILIVFNAGKSRSYRSNHEEYISGFGGQLAEVMIIVNKHFTKPDWSFKKGINVITQSYQRPNASAKPTNYIGGVQANFVVRAINALLVLNYLSERHKENIKDRHWFETLTRKLYNDYDQLNRKQREQLRYVLNDIRRENRDGPQNSNESYSINQDWVKNKNVDQDVLSFFEPISISDLTYGKMALIEQDVYPKLIQECVFSHVSDPNIILEGSTFSIMYIDQNDNLVFPAIDHEVNVYDSDLDNSGGKLLESTTILSLYNVAQEYNLASRIEKITFDSLKESKAVLAISSTRIQIESSEIALQQINTFNGIKVGKVSLPECESYHNLIACLKKYFENYEYAQKPKVHV